MTSPTATGKKFGLGHWMTEVLKEVHKAAASFDEDSVHDLRVALRRCRSIAEGFRAIDPDPAWKKMRKAGKELFDSLGDLRDCHVMMEWGEKLGAVEDPVTQKFQDYLKNQEHTFKAHASESLAKFDRKQWQTWAKYLPNRTRRLRPGSTPFQSIALERWADARRLHGSALRNRSKTAWHRLRIGVKKFRYVVENFLPELHERLGSSLKEIQDLLGEIHDLDVLWDTALQAGVVESPEDRERWAERTQTEREARVGKYREKMIGRHSRDSASLWSLWRSALPQGEEARQVVFKKLYTWASFLDSDFQHSRKIARLSLQLYDGLTRLGVLETDGRHVRELLQAAATMHDVGRSQGNAGHHKATARLIRKLVLPFGWKPEDLDMVALIARYHRGALPRPDHKRFAGLPGPLQQITKSLAGVLRLADVFDQPHDTPINRLKVTKPGDVIVIYAQGLKEQDRMGESIAGARYLLETICGIPIMVLPFAQAS
ncbi:MAG TPA: CHAD domain-containing protein [Candidatus Angelobacter sp.]|nr:CHAD domain-containing protein [Candidatus Angelobacter sp.]